MSTQSKTMKELKEQYPEIKAKNKAEMLEKIAALPEKESKVIDIKGEQMPVPVTLKLSVDDANNFMNILGLVLVGDDRLKPLQQHFIEMIKRNNEDNSKQSTK